MAVAPDSPEYVHPKKVVAAGALFLNGDGEILLVNPSYKWQWEIPGGVVEPFETPRDGCIREVYEEIGLTIAPDQLLGIDHVVVSARSHEVLRFIFWGGHLTQAQIDTIRLPADGELSEFGFFTIEDAQRLLTPALGPQLARILAAMTTAGASSSGTVYAETCY